MSNAATQIRFDDGAAYERGMGVWSQSVGREMLAWLAPAPGRAWLDVGCGNGAFTALVQSASAPAQIEGIDPSPAQIAYAQARPGLEAARFQLGDAMALPFGDATFDLVGMALVIFFVPEPPQGVAEMVRVARPGGRVFAYAWDIPGGHFPFEAVWAGLRECGLRATQPPNPDAARAEALHAMWEAAGLTAIEARPITVQRRFDSFDAFWTVATEFSSSTKAAMAETPPELRPRLREAVRAHLPSPAADGSLTLTAVANAIVGTKPG